MSKLFEKGSFTVHRSQRVVISTLEGVWSKSTVERYTQELKKVIRPIVSEPWAHLMDMRDWGLGGPEIEAAVRELVAWCYQHNDRKTALILDKNAVKLYQLDKMIAYEYKDFERQNFSDEQSALNWLAQQGYKIESR